MSIEVKEKQMGLLSEIEEYRWLLSSDLIEYFQELVNLEKIVLNLRDYDEEKYQLLSKLEIFKKIVCFNIPNAIINIYKTEAETFNYSFGKDNDKDIYYRSVTRPLDGIDIFLNHKGINNIPLLSVRNFKIFDTDDWAFYIKLYNQHDDDQLAKYMREYFEWNLGIKEKDYKTDMSLEENEQLKTLKYPSLHTNIDKVVG